MPETRLAQPPFSNPCLKAIFERLKIAGLSSQLIGAGKALRLPDTPELTTFFTPLMFDEKTFASIKGKLLQQLENELGADERDGARKVLDEVPKAMKEEQDAFSQSLRKTTAFFKHLNETGPDHPWDTGEDETAE